MLMVSIPQSKGIELDLKRKKKKRPDDLLSIRNASHLTYQNQTLA
jgi:hypothetical protein